MTSFIFFKRLICNSSQPNIYLIFITKQRKNTSKMSRKKFCCVYFTNTFFLNSNILKIKNTQQTNTKII